MKKYPAHWHEVYPQGTSEGNEEQRFFVALIRNPNPDAESWTWRSTSQIAAAAKLTPLRVEEIAVKYLNKGMVFQHASNVDQWGYWELNKDCLPKDVGSIRRKDQNDRIDKALGNPPSSTPEGGSGKKDAFAQSKEDKPKMVQKTLFQRLYPDFPHSH